MEVEAQFFVGRSSLFNVSRVEGNFVLILYATCFRDPHFIGILWL